MLIAEGAQDDASESAHGRGRAEQPRMARHAAQRGGIVVVDFADERPAAASILGEWLCGRRAWLQLRREAEAQDFVRRVLARSQSDADPIERVSQRSAACIGRMPCSLIVVDMMIIEKSSKSAVV